MKDGTVGQQIAKLSAALAAAMKPPVKPQRDEQAYQSYRAGERNAEAIVAEYQAQHAYQSYRAGERASYDVPPPPPLTTRALTIIPALVGFVVLDVTLVALTIANTVAIGIAPDPLSKGVFVVNEIILTGVDLFVAYLHVSYAHWVVTGRGIRNWADISDWELRP